MDPSESALKNMPKAWDFTKINSTTYFLVEICRIFSEQTFLRTALGRYF